MKPQKTLERLQQLKVKMTEALTYKKAWQDVVKEIREQMDSLIDGDETDQTEIFDRMPPRPEVPE